jgi:hypothetical protein
MYFYFYLLDRGDRLGANIINYIAQILYAYNNKYIIKFSKEKENYRYYNSMFVKTLFNYIEYYNEELKKNVININDPCEEKCVFTNVCDYINSISIVLKNIKSDYITFFNNNIYNNIKSDFLNLYSLTNIPFDVNKTILVHLRLEDVANKPDYDGSICSNYYKNKIKNNEDCVLEFYDTINNQAPLSKIKLDNIINKAKTEFPDYKVILITSPGSDTSFLNYEVIKSNDENLDLYFLTMCNVTILSRSTYALSSMFFNDKKVKTYIPLWGHFVCCGLDTIYDKNDMSKIEYFY